MLDDIVIFDTTLRDGEQSPGASMNIEEKIKIALQLEKLGVDVIEAGFAASSKGDFEAISRIAEVLERTKICSLARAIPSDIEQAAKATQKAKHRRIHTFIATSPIHMQYKLKLSPSQVIQKAVEAVRYAKSLCDDVEFSCEDALRSDMGFLREIIPAVIEAGASTINLPDTVGYRLPAEIGAFITEVHSFVQDSALLSMHCHNDLGLAVANSIAAINAGVRQVECTIGAFITEVHSFVQDSALLSMHCHNDLGLAVANSIAAINAGVRQVECTINGLGERAGNTALEELVMIIKTRKELFSVDTHINTKEIYPTSKLVADITGICPQPNKAIVGKNAFAHESGIHQDGVLKHRETYEIISPSDIGMPESTNLVLGKHSGRAAFKDKIASLGFSLSDDELQAAFVRFKHLCDSKKEVFDDDIRAIIGEETTHIPQIFTLSLVQVSVCSNAKYCAAVSIIRDGIELSDSALGNGAVDCVLKSIDRVSGIAGTLKDYKVESVTSGKDALAKVVVKAEFSSAHRAVIGHGIDVDTMSATAKAYISALNSYLSMRDLMNG